MPKCPYCDHVAFHKSDITKHVQVFHPRLTEEERLAKMRQFPQNWLKEKGFGRELNLMKQGKCPVCEKLVNTEELMGMDEWKEWQISGLCGPCQRKRKTEGL